MNTKKELLEYYSKYKILHSYHQEIFGKDKAPNVPVLFTESLCRKLYGMKKHPGKDCDAILGNLKIEIKATTSKSGTTTINPYKDFNMLYWLYLDANNDCLKVVKIPYNNFQSNFSNIDTSKDPDKKIRQNIQLKNFISDCEVEYFNLKNFEKIKLY